MLSLSRGRLEECIHRLLLVVKLGTADAAASLFQTLDVINTVDSLDEELVR